MFLSRAFVSERGSDATDGSACVGLLTALMVSPWRVCLPRILLSPGRLPCGCPLGDTDVGYSGEAVIPERPSQEDPSVPPRDQALFVMDLWAWVIRGHPRNGVGLSPVNVVSHYEQATPPVTSRVRRR